MTFLPADVHNTHLDPVILFTNNNTCSAEAVSGIPESESSLNFTKDLFSRYVNARVKGRPALIHQPFCVKKSTFRG